MTSIPAQPHDGPHPTHRHAPSAEHPHAGPHGPGADPLAHDNIHMPPGWGRVASGLLLGIGGVSCVLTALYPVLAGGEEAGKAAKHALAAYHVGFLYALGLALGSLGLVMIMHLVKAGWSVTMRRQIENVAGLLPVALALGLPSVIFAGTLFKWTKATDSLAQHKAPFLNEPFFYARLAVYALLWLVLAARLGGISRRQDLTRDPELTRHAVTSSAVGILVFALSVAFASFDLIMALDYHWYSTMFGVYFFAGNMIASLALWALVLGAIRGAGRLRGLVTPEHSHDLGKLMLGFTVFWAYISFSQYFLIWYANIPESQVWFLVRKTNGWENVFLIMAFGHFLAPFLVLLFRGVKRSATVLGAVAAWLMLMHALDLFWQVRPIVYALENPGTQTPGKMGLAWVDVTGLLGPVAVFAAAVVWKIGRGVLIPTGDPRLAEALGHKNYV